MSNDMLRALMYLGACMYAVENDACPTPAWCVVCHRNQHDMESAALAYDLAVAEASRQRTREAVAW